MNKKILDQLIGQSASGNSLDGKKVMKIADQLNRKQLKAYIDGLRRWRQKHTVIIETATQISANMKREFEAMFEGKKVAYRVRPDLIVGTRIINDDMIYEMSLKSTLQNMQQHINA